MFNKNNIQSVILLLSSIFLFSSCEDPIQVDLDKGAPLITVDAFVNDLRENQTIRLTYADDYFSQKASTGISGATVIVKDITTNTDYTFTDNNNGNYTYAISSNDTLIRLNHQYQLEITHQGNKYSATSSANRTTTVDSIVVNYNEGSTFSKEGYDAGFIGVDPTGPVPDYFWIKSYRNGVFYNKGIDINITRDGANAEGSDGFIFIPPIARGIVPGGERLNKYDLLRVEIHSISEGCYNFLAQVFTQTTNAGLFATTPENVKTNIVTPPSATKAVGWFNTSLVGWKQVVIE